MCRPSARVESALVRGDDVAERRTLVQNVVPRYGEAETGARPLFQKKIRDHPRTILELRDVRRAAALSVRLDEVLRQKLRRGEDDPVGPEAERTTPVVRHGDDLDATAAIKTFNA